MFVTFKSGDFTFYPMFLLLLLLPGLLGDTAPHPGPDPHGGSSPAVLYLPLGGGVSPGCQSAAGAKLTQLVPLMFAGMTFTIFDAVANINNRINSNNNNNNNQNINFQQSVNTVVTGNINVANQINVMNVMGRRRKRSAGVKISKQDKSRAARVARLGLESLITMD